MRCNCCGIILAIDCCDECDLILEAADTAISAARQIGAPKYGPTSWRHIDPSEHMLHAIEHMRLVGLGDTSEPHLSHAICRLAMAKAILSE